MYLIVLAYVVLLKLQSFEYQVVTRSHDAAIGSRSIAAVKKPGDF